jgi:hypothetical protein
VGVIHDAYIFVVFFSRIRALIVFGMKRKQIAGALVGVIVAALGLLWFLQGAGILHLCPVLCITDCECLTSASPFWEAAGAIVFVIGIVIVGVSVRRVRTL